MQRFNVRILHGEILNQEDRKVERVVPNALSWVRRIGSPRRANPPVVFPAFLLSASSIVPMA